MARRSSDFLNVRMPENETYSPSSIGPRGEFAAAGEAMQDGREGALPGFFLEDRAPCRRRPRAHG